MAPSALSQPWLLGALESVGASLLGIVGLTLLKAAQQKSPEQLGHVGSKRPARWCELLGSLTWWCGLFHVIGYHPINFYVLTFTPETTVVPLAATKVILNLVMAYGLLNERFTPRDLWATLACILGQVVAIASMPHSMPGYMLDFPLQQLGEFCSDLDSNQGFALYCLGWLFLLAVCVYASKSVSLTGDLQPCVLPLIVGLLNSQFHFATKVLMTLAAHPDENQDWKDSISLVALGTAGLAVAAVATTCEGVRQLDLRFFVPATFASTTVMIALEDVVFFREWEHMTHFNLVCFACGCMVTIAGAIMVQPSHDTKPDSQARTGNSAPLLANDEEPLRQYQPLLRIMEEHKIVRPRSSGARPLEVIVLDEPQDGFWALLRCVWRWVPIASCLGVLIMVATLLGDGYRFVAFSILTAWGVHNGWKYGLHMALFSYVGQRKMAQYQKTDFLRLHNLQRQQEAACGIPEPEGPRWEEVVHYVILPNYKEEMEVLQLAIGSIAASQIAAKQINLVLAMEAREKGSDEKAKQLTEEFAGQFRSIMSTFHPPNLPGETPGKSSNTNWAASQLFSTVLDKVQLDNIVITIADADSEFHFRYFDALTYQFVHADCGESETADRYLSIWQPPIIHYKNYHTQPTIVRLASLFTTQHELANLADPNAMRVPYSTYSISAALAKAVSGWDPDWISEDWHMGIKCFLATAGRIRIQPIFLGVLNYAPEGQSYRETIEARWAQAKRHALGFSEIVFFQDHFPRVLLSIEGGWRKRAIFVWRAFFLWSRCLLIHLTMATMLAIGPFTAFLVGYFLRNKVREDVNSWTFLTYLVFQSTGGISVVLFMFTNVLLYELTRSRIDSDAKSWFGTLAQHRWKHFLFVTTTSMVLMPFFFFAGGMAEWIAAIKTARTHKFMHDVAAKPSLAQAGANSKSVAPDKVKSNPAAVASSGV